LNSSCRHYSTGGKNGNDYFALQGEQNVQDRQDVQAQKNICATAGCCAEAHILLILSDFSISGSVLAAGQFAGIAGCGGYWFSQAG